MKRATKGHKKTIRRVSFGQKKPPLPLNPYLVYVVAEAAAILRLNTKTLRRSVKTGEITASLIRGGYRIKGSDIDEYLQNMRVISDNKKGKE